MTNGKPCCPGCAQGLGCAKNGAPPTPVQDWVDIPASSGSMASPFTLLDAGVECRTPQYDPGVPKSLAIV